MDKTNVDVFLYSLINIPQIPPIRVAIIIEIPEIFKCSNVNFKKKSYLSI